MLVVGSVLQQRTPQSVPRQATMAQAFSRANMHVEHHQVNAELRQLPPPLPQHSGWAAQQQQQPVRPNGRLAAGAMPHTSSTTSRPTQVMTAHIGRALPHLSERRPHLVNISCTPVYPV